ncbi:hypothetical protein ALT785_160039 [Alteromonas infernus]
MVYISGNQANGIEQTKEAYYEGGSSKR